MFSSHGRYFRLSQRRKEGRNAGGREQKKWKRRETIDLIDWGAMDSITREAAREARAWKAGGAVALVSGILAWGVNWIHNDGWWGGWLCGGLFVAVGGYLIRRATPFADEVERLVRSEAPCHMLVTVVVERGDPDIVACAELRFSDSPQGSPADVRVMVGYQPWFDQTAWPLLAKVWGARNPRGPVVIETAHGRLFPSGPGAVTRRAR